MTVIFTETLLTRWVHCHLPAAVLRTKKQAHLSLAIKCSVMLEFWWPALESGWGFSHAPSAFHGRLGLQLHSVGPFPGRMAEWLVSEILGLDPAPTPNTQLLSQQAQPNLSSNPIPIAGYFFFIACDTLGTSHPGCLSAPQPQFSLLWPQSKPVPPLLPGSQSLQSSITRGNPVPRDKVPAWN